MNLKVEVIKVYPFELPGKKSGVKAFADVRLGGVIEIRGVKLVRNKAGGEFIQMPVVEGREGSKPVVEILSKDLINSIRKEVKKALQETYNFSHYG